MANRLKMVQIQAVTALLQQGWSQRRIARELGIDRETVARYAQRCQERTANPANLRPGCDAEGDAKPANLRPGCDAEGDAKPANLHPGADAEGDANPANLRPGSEAGSAAGAEAQDPLLAGLPHGELLEPARAAPAGQQSACWPFREVIQRKVEQALSAQRIWQDLRAEHGFTASYYSVLRFVASLRPNQELPFRRLECAPGAEAQVDFGTGAAIVDQAGKRQRTHVFRIVLSHSRKAYSEAITRQTTDGFLACLENAFHHFGGAPRTLVIDNLKAAVTKADWFDPELNPKVLSFCAHYGVALLPTRPYTPRHKG
jgi:transposase